MKSKKPFTLSQKNIEPCKKTNKFRALDWRHTAHLDFTLDFRGNNRD